MMKDVDVEQVDVELKNVKNVLSRLQDQGLTYDESRLISKVTEQKKTEEAQCNFKNIDGKQLKWKLNKVNRILNYIATENVNPRNRFLKVAGSVVAKKIGF